MRLANVELDRRLDVKLDKSMKSVDDNVNGFMAFGDKNDYPQIIEKIINGSVTAKAAAGVMAKFLVGSGFENEDINSIMVGRDPRNKAVTLLGLLRQAALSVAYYNGFYIHVNPNLDRVIGNARVLPFKNCRFSKMDDWGYSAKIGVYDNWSKEGVSGNKKKPVWYPVFNTNEKAFASLIADAGGPEKFKGMIYFQSFDEQYFYPLSPFDPCYLDADTEQQIAVFKNNAIRNGFTKKLLARIAAESDEEFDKIAEAIKKMLGADGDNAVMLEADVDPATGKISKDNDLALDYIDSSINDKLFENWEKNLANNIRKSVLAIPAVLIDYEESKLGSTSGEAIIQATNFYNAMTQDYRALISQSFREIFSRFDNPILQANQNWNIKPINLYDTTTNTATSATGATGN